MNRIITPDLQVFYAEEGDEEHILPEAANIVQWFIRRPLFQEIIETWAAYHHLSGTALLMAHGTSRHSEWYFSDQGLLFPVQKAFLNQLDGTVNLIVLNTCNPCHDQIFTRKSIVIHSNEKFNLLALMQGKTNPLIFIPGFGYISESRKLRRVIDNIKSAQS